MNQQPNDESTGIVDARHGKGVVSRRGLLGVSAAALAGVTVGAAAGYTAHASAAPAGGMAPLPGSGSDLVVAFRGPRQAGIITPAQDRLHFVALDVVTQDRAALIAVLQKWTKAAERMTVGAEAAPGGTVGAGPYGVPQDTGEAYGLPASGLTLTVGFGPSLFDDRFGLAVRRPAALQDLPAFRGDKLDPARCGGDLCIQACAFDPQVAVHAVRNLIRLGFGTVAVRWSQLGFGRTSSTSTSQATPRNLFGFKDGTQNLKAEETDALSEHVWVAPADEPGPSGWLAGGSYLVARRIRMRIETWDRSTLGDQEQTIGRSKATGAPLGKQSEFDPADYSQAGEDGRPVIPVDSHIALANRDHLGGIRILRRGYNFADGSDGIGHLDAGLFFLAYMRNPPAQFVPMQRALAQQDRLNEYIQHTGSAVFACPPGLSDTGFWGDSLLT